jgi:hypothetical protein
MLEDCAAARPASIRYLTPGLGLARESPYFRPIFWALPVPANAFPFFTSENWYLIFRIYLVRPIVTL